MKVVLISIKILAFSNPFFIINLQISPKYNVTMRRINLYILLLIFSTLILTPVKAQDAPGRTVTTVVADALAQLPADKPADYNKTMTSLTSQGEEGIISLIQ